MKHHLPSFAAKEKQRDARYEWFVAEHGTRCWELDALSPAVLRDDVESAILNRLDAVAWQQAAQAERAECESLATVLDAWPGISRHAQKCSQERDRQDGDDE